MKVTKAIREYVEQTIDEKYSEVTRQLGTEYRQERQQVLNHLKEMQDSFNRQARAYLDSVGYSHPEVIFDMHDYYIRVPATENEIDRKRVELDTNKHAQIKQILFNLEIGNIPKEELKSILDSIVVEGA